MGGGDMLARPDERESGMLGRDEIERGSVGSDRGVSLTVGADSDREIVSSGAASDVGSADWAVSTS